MDLQQLKNFLVIAQEENITHAASYLHLSQPALSRQVKALEAEFGQPLLIREAKKVTLTKAGILLRKRAVEMTTLMAKTTAELTTSTHTLSGDILLGVSETDAIRTIGQAAGHVIREHPQVTLKLRNGDNTAVLDMVNSGVVDLGLYFGPIDQNIFNHLALPKVNRFGALMPRNHPLAAKAVLTPADLATQSLILYQAALDDNALPDWFHRTADDLNIAGTFDMYLSAKKLVESGLGIALVFDDLVDYTDTNLTCRPITPAITVGVNLIWKKYQIFSDTTQTFLAMVKAQLSPS